MTQPIRLQEMNEGIKIAILDMYNGHANEGMRCIKTITGRFLAQENIERNYDVFDVRQKNEVPDLSYDIYISSGGPGNPVPQGDAWETLFYNLLDSIWNYNLKPENEQKKYLFLICHSFQVAADYWDLGKVCKRRTTSFGIFPMHRTLIGHDEELFQNLPELFYAVDSRDYQLIEPNLNHLDKMGANILCIEKDRPNIALERAIMAIRFSEHIFGTQFHPEADAEGMLRYFAKAEKRNNIIENHGEEKYNDMVRSLQDPEKIVATEIAILPSFLTIAAEQLLGVEVI